MTRLLLSVLIVVCNVYAGEPPPSAEQISGWARDLSAEQQDTRDFATKALIKARSAAFPALVAVVQNGDADAAHRAEEVLAQSRLAGAQALDQNGSPAAQAAATRIWKQYCHALLEGEAGGPKSANFTVDWHDAPAWETRAAEINMDCDYGSGHGSTLYWNEFEFDKDGVRVISIGYDQSWYWKKPNPQPDIFVAKRYTLSLIQYQHLLHSIAEIQEAQLLKAVHKSGGSTGWGSSSDFYASLQLTLAGKLVFDDTYCGHRGSSDNMSYAKVSAATGLIEELLSISPSDALELTPDLRKWASDKFKREWVRPDGEDKYTWWTHERMLVIAGHAADSSVLPLLAKIIDEPFKHEIFGPRQRDTAVQAAAQLLGKTGAKEADVLLALQQAIEKQK